MTGNAYLASVRSDVVDRMTSDTNVAAVALAPLGRRVSGLPIKGSMAMGIVVSDDMEAEMDAVLAATARGHLVDYLLSVPGTMAVGVVGWRDGDTIHVKLASTRIDGTGEHPIQESVVEGPGGYVVAKMGTVLIDVSDVLADGTLQSTTTTEAGFPGSRLSMTPLHSLVDTSKPTPLAAALANLAPCLATETPTGSDVLRWMAKTFPDQPPKPWDKSMGGTPPAPAPKPKARSKAKNKEPRLRVDLGKVADVLRSQQRPAWLMDVRPGEHDEPDIVGSGGAGAFLPQGEAWPTFEGEPMTPVLQMDVAAFPEPLRGHLGGEGLYQLFAIEEYSEDPAAFLSRVVPTGTAGEWTPAPSNAIPGRVVAALREVVEGPNVNEHGEGPTAVLGKRLSENQQQILEIVGPTEFGQYHADPKTTAQAAAEFGLDLDALTVVADLLTHHDADKVGGWPSWAQAPEWPGKPVKSMVPLLNIRLGDGENDEVPLAPQILAGDGSLQVFVSTDGKRRFAVTWACG